MNWSLGTTDPICIRHERIQPILFCYWAQSQHDKWMPPSPNWDVLPIWRHHVNLQGLFTIINIIISIILVNIVERLTISRHVTLCYQLSTLVCLVLFCCCLLHCDKNSFVACVWNHALQSILHETKETQLLICHIEGTVMAHRLTYDDHKGTHQNFDVKRNCLETNIRVRPPYMCNGHYVAIRY